MSGVSVIRNLVGHLRAWRLAGKRGGGAELLRQNPPSGQLRSAPCRAQTVGGDLRRGRLQSPQRLSREPRFHPRTNPCRWGRRLGKGTGGWGVRSRPSCSSSRRRRGEGAALQGHLVASVPRAQNPTAHARASPLPCGVVTEGTNTLEALSQVINYQADSRRPSPLPRQRLLCVPRFGPAVQSAPDNLRGP